MGISVMESIPALPCGKALYSYEGKEPGDLQFSKGDIIILRRKVDDNWYHGELNSCHGFLPASYIQLLRPLSQTPPQGKALYDFEVKDKDQDKDCLAFSKDEVLTVIRRVDENWAEGMLGDKIGIFPILYVEDASHLGPSPSLAGVLVPPKVASITSELLAHAKVQLPLNIYLALYAYKPQKADELELRKGEMYRVTEKCQDGWFKGTSLRTAASGVFPGNYVTPVSRAPFGVGSSRSSVSSSPGSSSSRPSTPLVNSVASPASSPQTAAAQLKNCLRSSQHTANQARTSMQLVHQLAARSVHSGSLPAASSELLPLALPRPIGSSSLHGVSGTLSRALPSLFARLEAPPPALLPSVLPHASNVSAVLLKGDQPIPSSRHRRAPPTHPKQRSSPPPTSVSVIHGAADTPPGCHPPCCEMCGVRALDVKSGRADKGEESWRFIKTVVGGGSQEEIPLTPLLPAHP
ncbi:hypothetical protein KUCAC02_010681 [Chaenocephalus aceratus]|uniref:Uncharacterized protein n=1 Tax=Chaenocephalus aceratus TaxID=36190 RepID=A0ACB9W055_CHAAC|nr:hypothetical protein KUCAC02_010681 [Chaenocephalus aceratus]